MVDGDRLGVSRARAGGDHDGIGGELLLNSVDGLHLDRVLAQETRSSVKQRDAVAPDLTAHKGVVCLDDVFKPAQEGRNLGILLKTELERFSRPFEPIQMESAFSQCLAGDRAAIDTAAADASFSLNQGDSFSGFGALDRRFLSGWAGSNDDDIERNGCAHRFSAFTTASTWSFLVRS